MPADLGTEMAPSRTRRECSTLSTFAFRSGSNRLAQPFHQQLTNQQDSAMPHYFDGRPLLPKKLKVMTGRLANGFCEHETKLNDS
jgi:hypothetical protein